MERGKDTSLLMRDKPDPSLIVTGSRGHKRSKAWKRSHGYDSDDSVEVSPSPTTAVEVSGQTNYNDDYATEPEQSQHEPSEPPSEPPAQSERSTPVSTRPSSPDLEILNSAASSSVTDVRSKTEADRKHKFDVRFKTKTTSKEDVLKEQMKAWKLDVYNHYTMPPHISTDKSGNIVYQYKCKSLPSHPSIVLTRIRHDESTSNLQRHVRTCTPANSSETRAISSYAHGSTYTAENHQMNLAIWVARRSRPFAIVEDKELLDIFQALNTNCVTPSRHTVSRDVREIYELSKERVGDILRAYPGKLHICADGWTSPNVVAFIGTTVHWILDGKIVSAILDFIKATKAHTGVYLAARIAECLREYKIQDKIMGFTADNAANNDTLVRELSVIVPSFPGKKTRVRCFAHILNLIVKSQNLDWTFLRL
ncbi:hypothetical protein D9613_004308 [Agrocybe pediades]|uniref:Uncharacterized protein n=1 Tax=Agrocybe pediades TaxID=84607 RepID=A0A8H4QJC1_9AGAR|nr:hypothetical protein D9613_004308 [Agrocybe pediades]